MEKNELFRENSSTTHGSFGELLQGVLPGGFDHFLITLPIQCYSKVRFSPSRETNRVHVWPSHKTKSQKMAELILDHFEEDIGGELLIESNLPEGKGMASSSADLCSTAKAVARSINREVSPEKIMEFLREIEPTDGTMFSQHVFFFHRKVALGHYLGSLPPLHIISLDEGGTVDTMEFNARFPELDPETRLHYRQILDRMIVAFKNKDLQTIGDIATESAVLNQRFNPKRYLDDVVAICRAFGGMGVVVTHSGPCIGILLAKEDPGFERKQKAIRNEMEKLSPNINTFDTISSQNHIIQE